MFGEPGVIIELQQNEVYNPWWYTLSGPLTVHNDPRPQWGYFNQSVVHFAGFYDIFSSGQIVSALAVNESAQSGAVGRQILIVDPGSFLVHFWFIFRFSTKSTFSEFSFFFKFRSMMSFVTCPRLCCNIRRTLCERGHFVGTRSLWI